MHFHIMRHTGNLNGMYGNLNSHGCEWTHAQSRMITSPLRVQTHAGRPVRSSSRMYGMAQQINMYTRWDEKSREEEEEGGPTRYTRVHPSAHSLPNTTLPMHYRRHPRPLPSRYSEILVTFNKDDLHTTSSPLRVPHAPCSCTRLCF